MEIGPMGGKLHWDCEKQFEFYEFSIYFGYLPLIR